MERKDWDGVGIPTAGVECEYSFAECAPEYREWTLLRVLYSDAKWVIGNTKRHPRPQIIEVENVVFRRYETPEERAARRKNQAIKAMSMLKNDNGKVLGAYVTDSSLEILYDAIAAGEITGIPPFNAEV